MGSNAWAVREERPRAPCDFAADLCVSARLASPATRRVLTKMKPKPTSIPVISMTEPLSGAPYTTLMASLKLRRKEHNNDI